MGLIKKQDSSEKLIITFGESLIVKTYGLMKENALAPGTEVF